MSFLKRVSHEINIYFGVVLILLSFSGAAQEKDHNKILISGMVKVDVIYDFNTPSGDRINYSNILTDGASAQKQTRVHARESRLRTQFSQDVFGEKFIAIIEGDFYGGGTNSPAGSETISNSVPFRLRHAYISYENWLVGQTWSNYVDVKSFPESLDFSNETGQAFIRQAQIRYQHYLNDILLSFSFENPETDLYILEPTFDKNTKFESIDPIFDFTAKAKYQSSWGHISLQTVLRKQTVYVDLKQVSDVGYGLGSSGKFHIGTQDVLKFHYSQGRGIGRYIQEAAGAAGIILQSSLLPENSNTSLKLLKVKGGYLGYQHIFSKVLRTNINSGFIDIDYSPVIEQTLIAKRTEKLFSFHGNLIWSAMPNLDIGIEHSIAKLRTVSGEVGTIKRLQLSTKYRF